MRPTLRNVSDDRLCRLKSYTGIWTGWQWSIFSKQLKSSSVSNASAGNMNTQLLIIIFSQMQAYHSTCVTLKCKLPDPQNLLSFWFKPTHWGQSVNVWELWPPKGLTDLQEEIFNPIWKRFSIPRRRRTTTTTWLQMQQSQSQMSRYILLTAREWHTWMIKVVFSHIFQLLQCQSPVKGVLSQPTRNQQVWIGMDPCAHQSSQTFDNLHNKKIVVSVYLSVWRLHTYLQTYTFPLYTYLPINLTLLSYRLTKSLPTLAKRNWNGQDRYLSLAWLCINKNYGGPKFWARIVHDLQKYDRSFLLNKTCSWIKDYKG
jgi:hypothetical protein